jgi:Rrf2 family protein
MSKVFNISEATSMAIHAMALLAKREGKKMTTKEIAIALEVSEHHLSKVLQRLNKTGLVKAVRGPRGGFVLDKDPGQVTLLEIYEEFEGPIDNSKCLFEQEVCRDENCVLGGLIAHLTGHVKDYLAGTKLSDLKKVRLGKEELE